VKYWSDEGSSNSAPGNAGTTVHTTDHLYITSYSVPPGNYVPSQQNNIQAYLVWTAEIGEKTDQIKSVASYCSGLSYSEQTKKVLYNIRKYPYGFRLRKEAG